MEDDTFVSVFSGIWGFDLPLERLGWHCVAQVEIDPHAYRERWCGRLMTDRREVEDMPMPWSEAGA